MLDELAGYAVLYGTSTPGAGYAGTIVAACGIFSNVPCALAWTGGNMGGEVKRAVGIAMAIGIGNLGGWVLPLFMAYLVGAENILAELPRRSYTVLRIAHGITQGTRRLSHAFVVRE